MRYANFTATIGEDALDRLRQEKNKASGFVSAGLVLAMVSVFGGVTLSPTALDFGSLQVGAGSTLQRVTLTNRRSGDLLSGPVKIGGDAASDFRVDSQACTAIRSGQSCALIVEFKPQQPGNRLARIAIDTQDGKQLSAALTGRATVVSPASLSFEGAPSNVRSSEQRVVLQGSSDVRIRDVSFSPGDGRFRVKAGACRDESANLRTCEFLVWFTPKSPGRTQADLLIASNESSQPYRVHVTGTAFAASTPAATPPDSGTLGVNSGPRDTAVLDPAQAVPPTHTPAPTPLKATAPTPTPFVASVPPVRLPPAPPPALPPAKTAPPPLTAGIRVGPGLLDFTSRERQAQEVHVENPGDAPLQIRAGLRGAGAERFQMNLQSCSTPVPPGGTCAIAVRYRSEMGVTGPDSAAQLVILHNVPNTPILGVGLRWRQTVVQRPHISVFPSSLDFSTSYTAASARMMYQRPQLSFTVVNDGPVQLNELNLRMAGGSRSFGHTNNCRQLAPGQRCTEIVAFTPVQRQSDYRDRILVAEGNEPMASVDLSARLPSQSAPPPSRGGSIAGTRGGKLGQGSSANSIPQNDPPSNQSQSTGSRLGRYTGSRASTATTTTQQQRVDPRILTVPVQREMRRVQPAPTPVIR